MKKKLFLLGILLVVSVVLCSCAKENELSVKEDVISIEIDKTHTIKVNQTKEEPLTWTSADESVATVSTDGTVAAKGNGITTITASTKDKYIHIGVIVEGNEGYVDNDGSYVPVFDGTSNITEIVVGVKGGMKEDATVNVGETHQLRAYTTPSDSKDAITWRSDDPTVASVSESGVLKVNKKGTTTITAYAPNGVSGKMIVRCK